MNESLNRVRDVLAELIKAALISDDAKSLACREAASELQRALSKGPPDPTSLKIDGAWTLAIREAEKPELQPEEGQVNLTLPRECVFALDELTAETFDVDAAVERIRKSASTG